MSEQAKKPKPRVFPNDGGRYVIGEKPKPAGTASAEVKSPKPLQTPPNKTPEESAK